MKDYLIVYIDKYKVVYNTEVIAESLREAVNDFYRHCAWNTGAKILNIICLEEELKKYE